MVDISLRRHFIAKLLDFKLTNDRKEEVLIWKNALIKQVKSQFDINLNPAKAILALSVQEIIDELEISKEDHYRALSISKDEDLELHLKNNLIPTLLINILILV